MDSCPTTIADVTDALKALPGSNADAVNRVRARDQVLTKPPGSLGRLEDIVEHLAAWQGANGPTVDQVAVRVFAGNHGVARRGVSAFPPEVTAQMVANFEAEGAAVNQISQVAGASFDVIATSTLLCATPFASVRAAVTASPFEVLEPAVKAASTVA